MKYTQEDFVLLDKELRKSAEAKYRDFQGSLLANPDLIFYGVRVPLLRKYAKHILKSDWRGFIGYALPSKIHEIKLICGFVIAQADCDYKEKLSNVKRFVKVINNWAVCDTFCSALKEVKLHREESFSFLLPYFSSTEEYEVRFACVMALFYFLTDEYMDRVFEQYDQVKHEGYYVKMAVAWGVSMCFVEDREKTLQYIASCNLDNYTYNKSIQKMIESLQVSAEDKQMLRQMKR